MPNLTPGYLFMLGLPAASKITYVRPAGGPENSSNVGENANIKNLACKKPGRTAQVLVNTRGHTPTHSHQRAQRKPTKTHLLLRAIFKGNFIFSQEWPRQTKPKKGRFMNFSQGHSRTKVQCESCLFPKEKHQNLQNWRNS